MTNPIVTIKIKNGGIMKAELYPEIAPNTVKNFISLINKGYYNGIIFHRDNPRFYDPMWLSTGYRNGWTRLFNKR